MDNRLNLLQKWLDNIFDNYSIQIASDDASFRRYFRIEHNEDFFIAMDSPPDSENNQAFVNINKKLITNNIYVPKIINKNLRQGFLLLEDLGDITFLQTQKQKFDSNLYIKAIDEIIKIQKLNSNNIPVFTKQILQKEMQLLVDWYLPKNLSQKQLKTLQNIFDLLVKNAQNSKQSFVHRDYHSRNLMLKNNQLAIIDFQDAVIGSNTYDLVSLLKDAYFELNQEQLQKLLKYFYIKSDIKISFAEFEKQFDLMGLQRHLKILGIFKRLSIRDNKHQYLNNIALVKKYTLNTIDKFSELKHLRDILCSE